MPDNYIRRSGDQMRGPLYDKNGDEVGPSASLPSQTGNSGKFLTTNGTTASWGTVATGLTNTSEDFTASVDGSQTVFTLAQTPASNTLQVFLGGALQTAGGVDYTLSGVTITFASAPLSGTRLITFYKY